MKLGGTGRTGLGAEKLVRRDREASVSHGHLPRDSDPELAAGLTVHPVLEIISVIFHLLLPTYVCVQRSKDKPEMLNSYPGKGRWHPRSLNHRGEALSD